MAIHIRPATPDDAAAIWHLNDLHHDVRATVAQIRDQISRCQAIETALLAAVDGQIVGFLSLRLIPQITDPHPYAEVSELFVNGDFRRMGVARALMDEAVARSKAAGAAELILMTGFKNTGGQRFYHSHDFENYCLAMKKTL